MNIIKKDLKLTSIQKDLILGTILGDANMQTETKGITWRYRALHGIKSKEYLYFKYNILNNFCCSEPWYSKIYDERSKKTYERYSFNTIVHKSFRFYGKLFYKWSEEKQKFIKLIPRNIEIFLTPRVLAYWYMDDGALKWLNKSNGMRICTDSYTYICLIRLQKALKNKFNIETKLNKIKKNKIIVGYRIYIPEKSSIIFSELIKPYIIDCMRYKVSNGTKSHL